MTMQSDETRCAWTDGRYGRCVSGPDSTVHFHDERACGDGCSRNHAYCHPFVTPSAPPAEVEPHPWYGPCDGFRADGGCSECARVADAPADPQREREMTEDEAFAAYWGASSRADEYQETVARQAWKARGAYEAGRRGR
jgi:hypothetical protein